MNKIYFNNNWTKSTSKRIFYNRSFLNEKKIYYPDCNDNDLDNVISSAYEGFKIYNNYNLKIRSEIIKKIAYLIKKNLKKIAKYESEETGKKLINAENEIRNSLKIWDFAWKNVNCLKTKVEKENKRIVGKIFYEPVGTIALIIPWNYPFVVMSERLPFILAGGNSVIIKPSEYASRSIVYFVKLLKNYWFT